MTWFKPAFQGFVTTSLRDYPELVAGLDFSDVKRKVADELVRRLVTQETRYQDVAIRLMLEIAAMTRFPDIEKIRDPADRATRLAEAREAVARLQGITGQFSDRLQEQERLRAEWEASKAQAEALRRFDDDVAALKARFLELQMATDPRQRGYDFEVLLSELFKLFDMEPRLAYRTETEQIDGSLSFDTDDYILEAKWIAEPGSARDGRRLRGQSPPQGQKRPWPLRGGQRPVVRRSRDLSRVDAVHHDGRRRHLPRAGRSGTPRRSAPSKAPPRQRDRLLLPVGSRDALEAVIYDEAPQRRHERAVDLALSKRGMQVILSGLVKGDQSDQVDARRCRTEGVHGDLRGLVRREPIGPRGDGGQAMLRAPSSSATCSLRR